MIVDSHAHVFPFLGGRSGYQSIYDHLEVCRVSMQEHLSQPARRTADRSVVKQKKLTAASADRGPYGAASQFWVGEYGRFEWRQDGQECYLQYLPPLMRDMSCPPQLLEVLMQYAGIDRAVVQCGGVYGRLNGYYAEMLREHPHLSEKLLPLARIDEECAYEDAELARLEAAVRIDGLKGIWFACREDRFRSRYKPFWDQVKKLGVPVFLAFFPERESWCDSLRPLVDWLVDYSSIPCVLPQAFPLSTTEYEDTIDVPDLVKEVIVNGNIFVELAYPIGRGAIEEYPYPMCRAAVRRLYEEFGPRKLVWGSDIPMVERYCTYLQSLHYLTDHCGFISADDMELITSTNIAGMFGLDAE